jgi:hypothetical protein
LIRDVFPGREITGKAIPVKANNTGNISLLVIFIITGGLSTRNNKYYAFFIF